jgi:PAS domain S-box-containing protein
VTEAEEGTPNASSPRWNEADRLAALDRYAILDTPREADFDDIVRLAADVFDAPISVVNLIAGDRQWFKAEVGIGTDSLPLDVSICAHAILQPGIFVVPDTTADARFAANPLVTGDPGLRFYAGALLETPDGLPLGTVCVLDTKTRPHGITERQRLTLELLARQVMTQLELRREIALRDQRTRQLEEEIAARASIDKALRESEARFRNMADHAPVMMWVTDADGRCTYLNRQWYGFTGQTAEAAEGFGWLDAVHPDDRGWSGEVFLQANAKQQGFRLEYRLRRHDGAYRWALDAASPRFGVKGEFLGYIGSVIDIDERRETENALRVSEERYRTLFTAIEVGFCVIDLLFDGDRPADYRFVEANPAFERQTGLVDPAGRTARELVPDLEPHWFDLYARIAMTGEATRFEHGSEAMGRWFDVHALRIGAPEQRRVALLFNDITERRRAEVAIRELNETLEHRIEEALAERKLWADVIENSDALIGVVSTDLRYLALNTAYADEFARIYGVRPKVGDALPDLMANVPEHREEVLAIWRRALAGEDFTVVESLGDPDAVRPAYELRFNALHDRHGRFIGAFQYAVDVTARLRDQARLAEAEQQLRQAQKMEAVGQLTGGIAHDFNNMLAVTIGSLDLLNRRIGGGDARAQRYVDAAADGARRAASLTQRLLAFSRQQPLRPEPLDVNKLVAGMSDLLRHSLGSDVRAETVLAGGLWRTHADPNQLENVILNLAINARDAMPDGGCLIVETQNAHLDSRYAAAHLGVPAGQYVLVAISDTGSGMSEAVIAKAFDPFFTTKGVGKGTGLGLSQVYGFVKQSGGHVKIYSEPDQGTTVKVYLPRLLGDHAEPEMVATDLNLPVGEQAELILVVEDEPAVRRLSVEALGELGYQVLEADSAAAALRLLEQHPEIALLFTDVVMPETNGARLAEEARRQRPDLKVLFTTGYTRNAVVHNGVLDPGVELIGKPFTIDELAARVRHVLDMPLQLIKPTPR